MIRWNEHTHGQVITIWSPRISATGRIVLEPRVLYVLPADQMETLF